MSRLLRHIPWGSDLVCLTSRSLVLGVPGRRLVTSGPCGLGHRSGSRACPGEGSVLHSPLWGPMAGPEAPGSLGGRPVPSAASPGQLGAVRAWAATC